MFVVVVVSILVGMTSALVCTPQLCETVGAPDLSACKGGIIKNGGFCGCTDACAKVEGEVCQAEFFHGMIPAGTCDLGLHCVPQTDMVFGRGICVQSHLNVDLGVIHTKIARQMTERTKCQQMRITAMITMVIWPGKWTARCDAEGNFLAEQCDISGHCFCVTSEGAVIDGTKVLGAADCSSHVTATAEVIEPVVRQISTQLTKCEQLRRGALMSMVVWSGKWTPTCDAQGNFTPHQCYFSGQCFCVTSDGHKIEGSDDASDCSIYDLTIVTTTTSP